MKELRIPVFFVSALVLMYAVSPQLGFSDDAVVLFFLLLPLPVIWMVVRILKDGTPSSKTWEEYFYEDHAYKRSGREKMMNE
ncbi:hypothetical protein PDL71_01005 [Lacibacter sp. MH-610]|uniref:hypothetical protein n=1 Tax=Lacibacter sp. MH-610 TaxID=3020883 RepID=UPI0038913317